MLTIETKLDLCAMKRSSTEQKGYHNAQPYESIWYEGSKNFTCDIPQMKIAESNEFENKDTNENEIKSQDMEGDENTQSKEIEIDQSNEEKTVIELVAANAEKNCKIIESQNNKEMRVAFGIILRLVLPLANGVARSIRGIRDVRFLRILSAIASSRQALTSLLAFAANTISMNLSSVQVSHRIEPILKLLKLRKTRHGLESFPDVHANDALTPSTPTTPVIMFSPSTRNPICSTLTKFGKPTLTEQPASKCCSLKVLAEPPPDEKIRADVIFIHGLHGSLVNTWKQGLWENDRQPVEFQRPPRPPVRPPKRARYSRSSCIRPPHKQKRARFGHLDDLYRQSHEHETNDELDDDKGTDFTYICGEPRDAKVCDGIEYSFPTLRIRMNDDGGRLLIAEIKTNSCIRDSNDKKDTKDLVKTKPKITPNDPSYSKCWPGDWLPLDCPGVRVIAVNYTTDQYLWRPLWKKKEPRSNLIQRAREMAELLIEQKVGHGHPIIWVGHSKGGLFVKQIIVDAWESGRPAMAPFWRSARGCFFYSVPHRGSHLASIKAPLLLRSVELMDIEKNNKYLLDLHRRFAGLYYLGHLKIEVFSFVETALTLMSVLYLRIVGVDSADPGFGDVCGIRLDHREICKPRSRDCILYKELVKMIKKVY